MVIYIYIPPKNRGTAPPSRPVFFFLSSRSSCQVVYHYTDLPSAKSIVLGRRGLRVSRGGFKGGGVFFSKKSPVEDVDPAQGDRRLQWESPL